VIPRYQVSDGIYTDMTDGPTSPSSIALLRSSQLSRNKLLLLHIGSAVEAWDECRQALAVLVEAERQAPEVTSELIVSPFVGAWAARCVQRLQGPVESPVTPRAELGALTGLAAVAAYRAGIDAELMIRAQQGRVSLPTLGAVDLGAAPDELMPAVIRGRRIVLNVDNEPITVPQATSLAGPWMPVHTLGATHDDTAFAVALDDVDPYRGCYRKPLTGRLTSAEVASWADLFQQSWAVLMVHARGRALELTGGLRSLVPLSTAHSEPGLSATSGTAFGALGLTRPEQPEHLAATLVHEFQHSKLSAFLDLVPLYDVKSTDLYFAPWRPDPRPIGGLLQGAYAFLAVCDLWRRLSGQAGLATDAERHFAELREQLRVVLDTLDRSPHLNDDGRKFVSGMKKTHAALVEVDVPRSTVEAARSALDKTLANWKAGNRVAAGMV
jgi:HEXXH motif-containing protein